MSITQGKNGVKVSIGNHKIGTDTMIINMGPAATCPARKLGMCGIGGKCYARKAERQYYKTVPAYREYQQRIWNKLSADKIAADLIEIAERRRKVPIKYLRFSESGDFTTQIDVDKMSKIAYWLGAYSCVRVYGYTARHDLDYKKVYRNMVVNGSGFMVHNQFNAVAEPTGKVVCGGDCRTCNRCKVRGELTIQVRMH